MSSGKKLEEAQFFLELLDALDRRRKPLTHSEDTAKEASYLFAAVLNSFYSAVAIMRDEEGIDVKTFVGAYPEIYARAKDGGERAKTVHVKHTEAAFSGYIPPKGNEVNFDFRKTPLLIEEAHVPGRVDFAFGPDHYMFIELRDKLEHVTQFCYDHFYKLRAFHAQAGSP
ncbi:MAG TPA: hypothetical protein PL166_14640 [Candidatus Contendobacter sp.]|nr:hypothetical protein [Candidatus Contendobacter sp.]HRD50815.1 hypothetical protein [Candidatus Contendobacter sp.]